jgi:hypothetical protein
MIILHMILNYLDPSQQNNHCKTTVEENLPETNSEKGYKHCRITELSVRVVVHHNVDSQAKKYADDTNNNEHKIHIIPKPNPIFASQRANL